MSRQTGYELSEPCSEIAQFSSEIISRTIKSFTDDLQTKKGIAKNLLAKHRLAKILYDRHQIKISFFLGQNMTNFGVSTATPPTKQNRAAEPLPFGEKKIATRNMEFAPRALAPGFGFEPKYPPSKGGVLPLDDPGIYFIL